MTGEYERAETLLKEAHEINLKIGDTDGIASNDNLFAVLALSRNEPDRAEELSVEAIRILQERTQKSRVDDSLDILAAAAASRGEVRRAARIWGATAGFRETTGVIPGRDERELIGPHKAAARPAGQGRLERRVGKGTFHDLGSGRGLRSGRRREARQRAALTR